MWVEFRAVKNKEIVLKIAKGLMKVRPVKVEKTPEGWKLSIKLAA